MSNIDVIDDIEEKRETPFYLKMHLQWFSSEEEGRTEDPTEQKLRKAREEGRVPKSQEVTGAFVMLLPLLVIMIGRKFFFREIQYMLTYFFTDAITLNIESNSSWLLVALRTLIVVVGPIMGAAFFAAWAGNVVQVGFLFSTKPIQPNFTKIVPNIGKWLKQSIFSRDGQVNIWKSIFKVIIIGVFSYLTIRRSIEEFLVLSRNEVSTAFSLIGGTIFELVIQVAVILLLLSIADYMYQRFSHKESLKMTKHDVKEEHKESEGDPLIKGRLKQRMQEILSSNMVANVPKADVLVTNPTHFACALEYNMETMDAPVLTAKGVDQLAFRMRDIAKEHKVPIMENKPLARALYANVEVGETLPEEYWEVTSIIMSQVLRMRGEI